MRNKSLVIACRLLTSFLHYSLTGRNSDIRFADFHLIWVFRTIIWSTEFNYLRESYMKNDTVSVSSIACAAKPSDNENVTQPPSCKLVFFYYRTAQRQIAEIAIASLALFATAITVH